MGKHFNNCSAISNRLRINNRDIKYVLKSHLSYMYNQLSAVVVFFLVTHKAIA